MKNTAGYYSSNRPHRKGYRWFFPRVLMVSTLTLLLQCYLPWWSLAIGAFTIGFLTAPLNRSPFLAGFLGVFIIWAGYAAWIDWQTASVLSGKIIRLFPLPAYPVLLIVLTGIVGGLAGGFAAKTGDLLRRLLP